MSKLTDFEALQIAAVYFQGEKMPHTANTSDQRIEMLFDLAEKIQAEYEKRNPAKKFKQTPLKTV